MRGISTRIRWLFAVLSLLAMGSAALLYWASVQIETAYVFARDLPRHEFIKSSGPDYLQPVSVPKQRAFEAITDPRAIVGMYTDQRVSQGQLVHPSMLIAELPRGQRQFERGLLPIGTRAYPVDIPGIMTGLFQVDDLLDIYVLWDQDGEPSPDDRAVILLQKVTFLGAAGNGDQDSYLVALTPEQIAAYEGWKRLKGVSFTGAITQAANGDYQPLHEILIYPDYNNPENRDLFAPRSPSAQAPDVEGTAGADVGEGGEESSNIGDSTFEDEGNADLEEEE